MADAGYIGSIDQGTTSTRFLLYDLKFRVVASHQMEHKQILPRPGWVEHDPLEIAANTQTCITETLSKAGVQGSQVRAIGIANQRETTVVWDKASGAPLHNAIVWLDVRTSDICKKLETKYADKGGRNHFRPATGLPVSTYFSAVKIKWLLDNVPAVADAVARGSAAFGTVDSWLIWKLTGGCTFVTDVTNASRTMLMNLATCRWDPAVADELGIPLTALAPAIVSNAEGEALGRVAEGPLQGVPIAGSLGDQHAAMLGQGCTPGQAKNTYGTGCFLLLNTGATPITSNAGLLTTVCFRLGANAQVHYALEGSVAMAGAAVQWLRDNLGLISSMGDIEPLAATVADTGGVYFVPAFQGLFAPHWREDARGTIVGLSAYSQKAHIARAVLEAICYQTRDVIEAMEKDEHASTVPFQMLRADGGASSNSLLMQLQADILGVDVVRPADVETTARGAALAAALGVGILDEAAALSAAGNPDAQGTVFRPRDDKEKREAHYARWCAAVRQSYGWA